MSIDLTVQYPGKIGPATAQFPYGEPRNITAPSDGTGTPWEAAIVKDTEGFKQALLKSAAIVPSGTPDEVGDSEYLQSIIELGTGRAVYYDETGVADAYILTPWTNQQSPANYFAGMEVRYRAAATNTGPATINVNGLGVKDIRNRIGLALIGGELAGGWITLRYSGVFFEVVESHIMITGTISGNVTNGAGSPAAITHGLGTDDVDFGMSIHGATNRTIIGGMEGFDGRWNVYGDPTAGSLVLLGAGPVTGDITLTRINYHTSAQVITANYWIRKRLV